MWNFRSPEMYFSFSWKFFFSFAEKWQMDLWASRILQSFAVLKRKKKKKLVWRGFEPLAVEVVKKQLKEIDGEREAVDARGRALHREATVTLDKFWPIFNINTFGAIVKGNMGRILISIQNSILIYTQQTRKKRANKITITLFPQLKVFSYTVHFCCFNIVP